MDRKVVILVPLEECNVRYVYKTYMLDTNEQICLKRENKEKIT